ncbi:nitrous oxide-stimulated promoter family protein [Sulfurospirillum sp. 1307]|jgi:hypothetical protein
MTNEKFIKDTKTVLKFIQLYCDEKHQDEKKSNETLHLNYKNVDLKEEVNFNLCSTCKKTFLYSYERLQECPHEEKPRCRKCPNPCYEKSEWKKLAKIMRFSGMKLGLLKIRRLFKKS